MLPHAFVCYASLDELFTDNFMIRNTSIVNVIADKNSTIILFNIQKFKLNSFPKHFFSNFVFFF